MSAPRPTLFAQRLLDWHRGHGRKDLPWQRRADAYARWVSEIMLQQTQVSTVVPYYERFLARFPDVRALAAAPTDDVLHLWTGLGYYARARNLHRAAQLVVAQHGGRFPRDIDAARCLPGIGRSTAGAILAFAYGARHPILDGNVKRVLTRYYGVDGHPGEREVEKRLWRLAGRNTPHADVADYTQAIMDLGATLCRRARADCAVCPVAAGCRARKDANPQSYPTPRRAKERPRRAVAMVMIRDEQGRVLLERRPPAGIWGGLWSLPELDATADIAEQCGRRLGLEVAPGPPWEPVRHGFSHYRLDITPVPARLVAQRDAVMEAAERVWYNPAAPDARGLAAPVKRLLEKLKDTP